MREAQSFRFDEWTTGAITNAAESLNVTRTEVVELAVQAFVQIGIAEILEDVDSSEYPGAYSEIIAKVVYETDIFDEVKKCFDASLQD